MQGIIKLWDWDKKPRTMDRFVKRGDIFCFQYDDTRYCFGRIIELTPEGALVEIFDYVSNKPCIDINTIEKCKRMISPIIIDTYELFDRKREGEWRIIGHQEDYKAFDYDNIYLTYGLDGDWKKKDLYGNMTRISDEEHYNYILRSAKSDCNIKDLLETYLGSTGETKENVGEKESNNAKSNADYLKVINGPDCIEVLFDIENPKVMAIGEEMQKRCSDAYMNGYNWEAFLDAYIREKQPAILEEMKTDAEAGSYVAIFDEVNEETRALANAFVELIKDLIEKEESIYVFLDKHKDDMAWD